MIAKKRQPRRRLFPKWKDAAWSATLFIVMFTVAFLVGGYISGRS